MLHTINPEILFLKQEDVIKAGLDDIFLLKEQNFGIDRVKHFCFL